MSTVWPPAPPIVRWCRFFLLRKGRFFIFNTFSNGQLSLTACHKFSEGLCINSQFKLSWNNFSASYEASEFCWQLHIVLHNIWGLVIWSIIGTNIKWLNRLSLVICEGSVRKANKSEPIKTLPRCQQNSHNNCRCCQKVQNCPNMAILRTKTCSFLVLCHFWVWGRGALKIYL